MNEMRKSASSWRIYVVCAMKFKNPLSFFLHFGCTKGKMGVVAVVCIRKDKTDD